MDPSVAVITATTGSRYLRHALASVKSQIYQGPIQHWVVVDGPAHEVAVQQEVDKVFETNEDTLLKVVVLPENTGGPDAGNFVCHRIYAALPWCVNTHYVCFLDEDNEFAPDHIANLVLKINGRKWAHSLRCIIAPSGAFLMNDNCESLGGIRHTVLAENDFLVDTNCYLLETDLARQLSPCWNVPARPGDGRLEADRSVCRTLFASKLWPGISRSHSVKYRVSGRQDSVAAGFFEKGNAMTKFDPQKPDIYVLHFTAEATKAFLERDSQDPLAEWALTMWEGLKRDYNVLNGFSNASIIPAGAVVLATVWHPNALPLISVLQRADIKRVLCMVESPNVRHARQYTLEFLNRHADIVLTYWTPLLERLGTRAIYCPMNTHALDLENPAHRALGLRHNHGKGKSVAIVLEKRSTGGTYEIDGSSLRCTDPLRELYAKGLRDIHCYGKGWDDVEGVTVKHTLGKMDDPRSAVDILQQYSFALIIENCDAAGYVSEKLYDCLMAGTIPIYWGNPCERLGLPSDVYIDLKKFEDGHALQKYMDALAPEDVYLMKAKIVKKREAILKSVGIQTFSDVVMSCFCV